MPIVCQNEKVKSVNLQNRAFLHITIQIKTDLWLKPADLFFMITLRSFQFSIVLFQKVNIPPISHGCLRVVFQKCFKQFCGYLAGFCPFIDHEVPGMLASFTSVDQPHINAFSVGVHPEFTGIHKLLSFPAPSAAFEYSDLTAFRYFHHLQFRQVSVSAEFLECFFRTKKKGGTVL